MVRIPRPRGARTELLCRWASRAFLVNPLRCEYGPPRAARCDTSASWQCGTLDIEVIASRGAGAPGASGFASGGTGEGGRSGVVGGQPPLDARSLARIGLPVHAEQMLRINRANHTLARWRGTSRGAQLCGVVPAAFGPRGWVAPWAGIVLEWAKRRPGPNVPKPLHVVLLVVLRDSMDGSAESTDGSVELLGVLADLAPVCAGVLGPCVRAPRLHQELWKDPGDASCECHALGCLAALSSSAEARPVDERVASRGRSLSASAMQERCSGCHQPALGRGSSLDSREP